MTKTRLSGKEVILVKTKTSGARTKYSVTAIPYKKSYIILNTSFSNRAVLKSLNSKKFSFLGSRKNVLSEQYIGNYKADIIISTEQKTIIEIKSVISLLPNANFPTVYSQRGIDQLYKLIGLMQVGYKVCYFIISLNPYVNQIHINSKITEYHALLISAQEQGMVLKAYGCKINNNLLKISKEIPILFSH